MSYFHKTTHLSEIIEKSNKTPVIIFKYSSECNSSFRLEEKLEEYAEQESTNAKFLIYKVTVQTEPILSNKITEWFGIKHESPQILIINKGKVTYNADHEKIKIMDFVFN